ncbi:MAG: YceI family protein [Rhodanobacteraceae bacterium]|nr:MAG: YceI family protein [Rhodanobacteraceae bacterium]
MRAACRRRRWRGSNWTTTRWNPVTDGCTRCGRRRVKAALALAWLLLPGLAVAAASSTQAWPIDPAQSQVRFGVRKFWFAHVHGTFPALSGGLRRIDTRIDADLGEVDAEVLVAGLQMDDAGDRARALGPDFFDAARFPSIHFDSDPFPIAELVSGGTLRGMLALHGERKPVTLTLQPSDCPRQPLACVIRVRGAISRSAFGMRDLRGVLSDKVVLDLRIRLKSGA